jgi:hypothetical protein
VGHPEIMERRWLPWMARASRAMAGANLDQILSQLIVGIPTGLGAAWLALFKFQAQRRWERKEEAYREVLEALHEMRRANDVLYEIELERRDVSEDRLQALRERWRNGQLVVYRFADIGSVLLSPDAERVLSDLKKRLEGHFDSYFEELEEHFEHLKIAMASMKRVAVADRQRLVWWKFKEPTWFSQRDTELP